MTKLTNEEKWSYNEYKDILEKKRLIQKLIKEKRELQKRTRQISQQIPKENEEMFDMLEKYNTKWESHLRK
jgi:hypothetical protein